MRVQVPRKNNRMSNRVRVIVAVLAVAAEVMGVAAGRLKSSATSTNVPECTSAVPTKKPEDAVTKMLREGGSYQLVEGENEIDLDLDGAKEVVTLTNKKTGTSINGYEIDVSGQVIKGEVDTEDGLKLYAFMLGGEKSSVQLIFTRQYLSDDYLSDIYNYENKKLVKVGTVACNVEDIQPLEDGSFQIHQQNGILGLMKDSTVRMVANNGKSEKITGKYCIEEEDLIAPTMDFQYSVMALKEVRIYKDMNTESGIAATFKVGENGQTMQVFDGKWLYIKTEKGEAGYLPIDDGNILIDGQAVKGWEVFVGLPFAG